MVSTAVPQVRGCDVGNWFDVNASAAVIGFQNVNYGRGDQFGSSPAGLSYTSIAGTGGVVYKLSPETFLGLDYTYANFDNEFNGKTYAFDRHVVQLSLTRAFN
jgi:hypothetical protein